MIEGINIRKSYRKREVLKGASFFADAGTCVGIVGGNGCGKTTLLSILAGAVKADGGSAKYDGKEILGNQKELVELVAYVPQENPIIEELSVKDNLRLWYKGDNKNLEADLETGAAGMLGLAQVLKVPAGKLSGGMKKRLSIACALSGHAPVLIMDEPGAALDLVCKQEIAAYLKGYLKQGGTVLLCSHELAELEICDRMYMLAGGILEPLEEGIAGGELTKRLRESAGYNK